MPKPAHYAGRWVYAPYSDWLWGCDADRFWKWHPEALEFAGTKVVVRAIAASREQWRRYAALQAAGVKVLKHSGHKHPIAMGRHEGASPDPGVVHGNNALFQVLSVIIHTGASTVLLLGADMHGRHWHGGYRDFAAPDYALNVVPNFASLVRPLAKAGVVVLNATPGSALPYWPSVKLEDVL